MPSVDVKPNAQLSDLVDFALGYPEVGVVNFNALHQLLHAIVGKLNFGADNELKLVDTAPRRDSKLAQLWQKAAQPAMTQASSPFGSKESLFKDNNKDRDSQPSFRRDFKVMQLQKKVDKMEDDLNSLIDPKLPALEKLSDKMKSDKPIADVWQLIALTKKAEATEVGVQAAMGLIQQTFRELKKVAGDIEEVNAKLDDEGKSIKENKTELDLLNMRFDFAEKNVEVIDDLKDKVGNMLGESPEPDFAAKHELDDKQARSPDHIQKEAVITKSQPHVTSSNPKPKSMDTPTKKASSESRLSSPRPIDHHSTKTSDPSQAAKTPADQQHTRQSSAWKIPNVRDMMSRLDKMADMMNAMPTVDDMVTWPVLEGALNGLRKPIMDDHVQASTLEPGRSSVRLRTLVSTVPPPSKTESVSTMHTSRRRPSEDIYDVLENLGTVNRRFNELQNDVKDLASELSRKADKESPEHSKSKSKATAGEMEDHAHNLEELSQQVKTIAAAVEEISYLKPYLQSLEVLLADIPEARDNKPPKLGDKSRASSATISFISQPLTEPSRRSLPEFDLSPEPQNKPRRASEPQDARSDHASSITSVSVEKAGRERSSKSRTRHRQEAGTGSEHQLRGSKNVTTGEAAAVNDSDQQSTDRPNRKVKHHKKHRCDDDDPDRPDVKTRRTGSNKSRSSSKPSPRNDDRPERDFRAESNKDIVNKQAKAPEQSRDPSIDEKPKEPEKRNHPPAYQQFTPTKREGSDESKRKPNTQVTRSSSKKQTSQPDSKTQVQTERGSKQRSRLNLPGPSSSKHASKKVKGSDSESDRANSRAAAYSPDTTDEGGQKYIPKDWKLRQLYDQKRALKELLLSERELFSTDIRTSPLHSIESALPGFYDADSKPGSPVDIQNSRFNSTLREIISSDYMAEIQKLQRRMDKLELKVSYSIERDSQPIIQYIGGLDDERLDRILHRMDSMKDEINRKIRDMDDELYTVLEHGVGDGEAMLRTQVAMGDLQSQLEALRQITQELQTENEQKTQTLQLLAHEAEKLNEDKVGRNTLTSELNLKANLTEMETKINTSEFEAINNDLQFLIDDLVNKLIALETAWKKAHGKLEDDLTTKEDSESIEKLKRIIDRKMKELNQKLKDQQALLTPSADNAAGLRSKLPFNCLSCDKPVAGIQYGPFSAYGDCFSPTRAGQTLAHYSASDLQQIRDHANSERIKTCGNLSQLKRNNMKAYMVHFGKESRPKVFITRSKARMEVEGSEDLYANPRACGGKHTVTQNKTQGHSVTSGKSLSLKDILHDEEFVAAGNLNREESVIHGADGRTYKSRNNIVDIDDELTKALLVSRDPIMPLVDEIKQSRSRVAATASNEHRQSNQPSTSRNTRLNSSNSQSAKTTSSEQIQVSQLRHKTPQSEANKDKDQIEKTDY